MKRSARASDARASSCTSAPTSTSEAPWYVIPADHKWLMRTAVAQIVVHHLDAMDPRYPQPDAEEQAAMEQAVAELTDDAQFQQPAEVR